jgi:hypothetical protein
MKHAKPSADPTASLDDWRDHLPMPKPACADDQKDTVRRAKMEFEFELHFCVRANDR